QPARELQLRPTLHRAADPIGGAASRRGSLKWALAPTAAACGRVRRAAERLQGFDLKTPRPSRPRSRAAASRPLRVLVPWCERFLESTHPALAGFGAAAEVPSQHSGYRATSCVVPTHSVSRRAAAGVLRRGRRLAHPLLGCVPASLRRDDPARRVGG